MGGCSGQLKYLKKKSKLSTSRRFPNDVNVTLLTTTFIVGWPKSDAEYSSLHDVIQTTQNDSPRLMADSRRFSNDANGRFLVV